MSRIPMMGKTADIPGALNRGYRMAREKKQGVLDDRINTALEDYYGDSTQGVLAAHRPDILNAEAGRESARVKGERDQWEFDRKKETAGAEDQAAATEALTAMAPSVHKMLTGVSALPESERMEQFKSQAAALTQAHPEFGPIAEQVMADGLLTDQELTGAMANAENLMKDAKPTSKMQDFEMAQENPDFAEFLEGDPKAPEVRKRALSDGMVQDEEFSNGQWSPVGEPYSRRDNLKSYSKFDPETGEFETGYMDIKTGERTSTGSKPNKGNKVPKLTEGERAAQGYLGRMEAAQTEIDGLGEYDPTDFLEVASGVTNTTKTANKQQYDQAAADWIRAKLRKESGAVIAPKEMEQEYDTYFPIWGDSNKVIEQKARSRKQAEQQVRTMAGNANKSDPISKKDDSTVTIGNQQYAMTDIEHTAKKHGLTVDQVKEQLGAN